MADRGQILGLLKSMGIELSPNTKMKDNMLEKKLSGALTASQSLSTLGPSSLNPLELPLWTGTGKASAFEAMCRTSMAESLGAYENKVSEKPEPFPLYESAFMDARQTCRHFAYHFAADKGDSQVICIRLLQIYKLLLDGCINMGNTAVIGKMTNEVESIPHINAAVEEQALFHKVLAENARRVSIAFKPKKKRYEDTFKPSFVVPIGPLSQIDIGKLTYNTGCEICGNKTTSRCSQFCQKAHWPEHKTMCKSLKGGTWQTIKFHTNIRVDGQLLTCAHINHHGPVKYTIEAKSDEIEIPVNVHGDQAFLIKLQRRLSEQEMTMPFISPKSSKSDGYQSILVYDRQRSFRAHVWNFTNVGVYEQVLGHIWAEENQKKMYRWARRVGDHELSVCLDRSPVPVPTW
ncbi:hypothetical protein CPB85DRAFT_1458117 [Mucidula mucida]|nr:hypothetical protein CPB85DRAFT_1458117 [Mucidula mucida]